MQKRGWVMLLLVLSSCTSAVDEARPASSATATVPPSTEPEAAPPSEPPTTAEHAGCSVVRGTDIDTSATGKTPEAALAAFTKDRLDGFAPVVRSRGVTFYAKDGSRSVLVERVERGWAVTGFNEPSCTPAVVRRGLRSHERDMACTRAIGGSISVGGPLITTSELEAVAEYVRFVEQRDSGPVGIDGGAYVRLGKAHARGEGRFGHFDERGLQSVVGVNAAGGKFAVDTINWC